jgi:hypothetical protein
MDARNKPDRFILNYWQPETTIEKGIANIIKEMDNA